MVTIGNRIGL